MSLRRFSWLALFLLLIAALIVVAIAIRGGASEPTPEPTPTRPLRPTFTPTVAQVQQPAPVAVEATATPVPAEPVEEPTPVPPPTDTPVPAEPPTETPVPPTPTPAVPSVIIDNPTLNVRRGPGTAYPILGQVKKGERYDIRGKNNAGSWWQIDFNGQNGWVSGDYVKTQGDAAGVQVAANIPPPPTRPPTATPKPAEPTATPVPQYAFVKFQNPPPQVNTNSIITLFGMVFEADAVTAVGGGHKLVVEGPLGHKEADCAPVVLRGNPGQESEFIYNCKVEFMGTAEGNYRAWVIDPGGAQVSEVWDNVVSGELRTFLPRWKRR